MKDHPAPRGKGCERRGRGHHPVATHLTYDMKSRLKEICYIRKCERRWPWTQAAFLAQVLHDAIEQFEEQIDLEQAELESETALMSNIEAERARRIDDPR